LTWKPPHFVKEWEFDRCLDGLCRSEFQQATAKGSPYEPHQWGDRKARGRRKASVLTALLGVAVT